ncbi:MAG: late competence development ComFB family protein [Lachnospiraceae bacterium]|nr:late competence development ComFB family protein [Lachnospiraceae bacterium]
MAKRTNKTEHVLNLISKAKEANITEEDDDDVEIQTIESKVTPDLSFVDLQLAHDSELSEKIKETLEEREPVPEQPVHHQSAFEKAVMDAAKSVVEEETPSSVNANEPTTTGEQETEQESYVIQSKNKDVHVEPLPDLDALEELKTEPSSTAPTKATTQTVEGVNKQEVKKVEEERFTYVNVVEEIVKDRVGTYMRKFGVCTCPRCVADTIALTLNGLTPKYVVLDSKNGSPMFNYLETQYAGAIAIQLSQACIIVKNNPYH